MAWHLCHVGVIVVGIWAVTLFCRASILQFLTSEIRYVADNIHCHAGTIRLHKEQVF
jgi:hypothetical protein